MTRKQVVLVLVEGPSDETALGLGLSEVFNPDKVIIEVLHTDITSDCFVDSSSIVKKINSVIVAYLNNNKFIKRKDIRQIIHIVDTDGVFVGDDSIIEDKTVTKTQYSPFGIITNNKKKIIERNKRKQANLIRLMCTNQIASTPYAVYYMSSNLDQVLYNKLNSSDKEKELDAYEFAKKYKDDMEGFRKYICQSEFSVQQSYKDSWEFIQKDKHSLERYTNLGLSFPEETEQEV